MGPTDWWNGAWGGLTLPRQHNRARSPWPEARCTMPTRIFRSSSSFCWIGPGPKNLSTARPGLDRLLSDRGVSVSSQTRRLWGRQYFRHVVFGGGIFTADWKHLFNGIIHLISPLACHLQRTQQSKIAEAEAIGLFRGKSDGRSCPCDGGEQVGGASHRGELRAPVAEGEPPRRELAAEDSYGGRREACAETWLC